MVVGFFFLDPLYVFFSFSTAEILDLFGSFLGLLDDDEASSSIQEYLVPGMSGSSSDDDELIVAIDIDYWSESIQVFRML